MAALVVLSKVVEAHTIPPAEEKHHLDHAIPYLHFQFHKKWADTTPRYIGLDGKTLMIRKVKPKIALRCALTGFPRLVLNCNREIPPPPTRTSASACSCLLHLRASWVAATALSAVTAVQREIGHGADRSGQDLTHQRIPSAGVINPLGLVLGKASHSRGVTTSLLESRGTLEC